MNSEGYQVYCQFVVALITFGKIVRSFDELFTLPCRYREAELDSFSFLSFSLCITRPVKYQKHLE